jgi:hypothetical protein
LLINFKFHNLQTIDLKLIIHIHTVKNLSLTSGDYSWRIELVSILLLQPDHSHHRYLMSRLSLKVFYLWRHVLSTAPPFIFGWSNLEILLPLLHRSSPFIGGLRCQAIQREHGRYIAERTQKAVNIVRCLWFPCGTVGAQLWAYFLLRVIYLGTRLLAECAFFVFFFYW